MSEPAKWYVVHTYSGYENTVKATIEKTVENRHLENLIHEPHHFAEPRRHHVAGKPGYRKRGIHQSPIDCRRNDQHPSGFPGFHRNREGHGADGTVAGKHADISRE